MPAIYAHHRFGMLAARALPGELREVIRRYPAPFAVGLQGPDLLFFYRPLGHNTVTRTGVALHTSPALPFIEHALKVVREHDPVSGYYAYALGFICHFVLDSECHPYIESYIGPSGTGHLEIEAEYEKYLLRLDGRDPLGHPVSRYIDTDPKTAHAIAPFYENCEGIDEKIIRKCLIDMRLIKRFFTAPGRFKQDVIRTVMKITRNYYEYNGLMNQRTDNPKCKESNIVLKEKTDNALPLAVELMMAFDESRRSGAPLPERFDRNFV